MKPNRIIAVLIALVAILIVVTTAIGWMTPVKHVAVARATIAKPPAEVWPLITDLEHWPDWNGGTMQRLPDREGRPVWAYTDANGRIASEVVAVSMSNGEGRMVTRIVDQDLPFGGSWTWEIAPADGGGSSRVSITENGEIYNPFFRFMARFFLGYTSSMEGSLKNLAKKFGQEVTPETESRFADAGSDTDSATARSSADRP